ncbi:hypothetical protein EYB39_23075 [Pantoea agglomerans]|nr:hypothetical protein EYB39_23075 [Pantoea agglomerans]
MVAVVKKLISVTTEIIHTRLQLAVTELEEEKNRLFRLLLLTGFSLMFTAFGVISLLVYALLIAAPYDRPATLLHASIAFIILAAVTGALVFFIAGRTSLLSETRKQLGQDLHALRRRRDE